MSAPTARVPFARAAPALSVALLLLATYAGSFDGQFVSDDIRAVRDNPLIRGLGWEHLRGIFTSFDDAHYIPIKVLSLAIDYRLWGPDAFGFHVTNLAIHVFCALAVYAVLLRFDLPRIAALLTALLWAVHPLQVESVAWIAERKNVLSGLFFFLAFLRYLSFSETGRWRTYLGMLALFTLAVLSKMNTMVLPALCLAYEATVRFRLRRRDLAASLPLFAIGTAVAWYTITGHRVFGVAYHGGSVTVTWLSSSVVVFRYLQRLFAPANLAVYYTVPLRGSALDLPVAVSLLGLAMIALLTLWLVATRRPLAFWALWFFITLAPMLNIIPFPALMQDRYMYLPMLGPLAGAALCITAIPRPSVRRLYGAAAVGAISVCALLSSQRVEVWSTPLTHWQDWASRNFYIAADSPHRQTEYDTKVAYLRQELTRRDESAVLHNALGALYFEVGRMEVAIPALERALDLAPEQPTVLLNLGRAYARAGDLARAEATLQRASIRDPYAFMAHWNLGRIYQARGDARSAADAFAACARLRPHVRPPRPPPGS